MYLISSRTSTKHWSSASASYLIDTEPLEPLRLQPSESIASESV